MIFKVTADLETPAMVSQNRAVGNFIESDWGVPGRMFRGAAAQQAIQECLVDDPAQDPTFRQLFLEHKVHFGDLRIEGATAWPLTARGCRAFPHDHAIIDLLLSQAAGSVPSLDCPISGCGAKREKPKKLRGCDVNGSVRAVEPETQHMAHVGIDPLTMRAEASQFYSTRLLSPSQRLNGHIWAAGESAAAVRSFFLKPRRLQVGRGRTRGQGRLAITIQDSEESTRGELREQVMEFNRLAWELFPDLQGRLLVSVTLRSPCLLLDDWLLSRSFMSPADLGSDFAGAGFRVKMWSTRMVRIAGWHAAAQLPKPETSAIAAGSAFLFERQLRNCAPEAVFEEVADSLLAASGEGIGERRQEGFGEVTICDNFHTRYAAGDGD
jgi:CRISPR-associated Csx10 family RAMP protein